MCKTKKLGQITEIVFNMNKSWHYHTCPETLDEILVCPTALQNYKKQLLVIGKTPSCQQRASSLPAETKNCDQRCKPACRNLKTYDRGSCWASLTAKHSCGSFEGKSVVLSRRSLWPHLRLGIFEFLHTVRHWEPWQCRCMEDGGSIFSIWCFTAARHTVAFKGKWVGEKQNEPTILWCLG